MVKLSLALILSGLSWQQGYMFLIQSNELILLLILVCLVLIFFLYLSWRDIYYLSKKITRQQRKLHKNDRADNDKARLTSRNGEKTVSIVHEIKQPLSVMTMLADRTINDMAGPATKERDDVVLDNLKELASQGQRCSRIIEKIQNTTLTDQKTFKPTEVNPIIIRALHEIRHNDDAENVTIRHDLQEDIPPVMADSKAIHQLLTNLFNKALDAMRNSNTKILTICSRKTARGIHVEVTDTGRGIAKERTGSISHSLYDTRGDQGIEPGRSIYKTIADDYNGMISTNGEPDKGISFKVFLPVNRA